MALRFYEMIYYTLQSCYKVRIYTDEKLTFLQRDLAPLRLLIFYNLMIKLLAKKVTNGSSQHKTQAIK